MFNDIPGSIRTVYRFVCQVSYYFRFAAKWLNRVRIGNLLGESNAHRAGVASKTSLLMSLLLSGISWYASPYC